MTIGRRSSLGQAPSRALAVALAALATSAGAAWAQVELRGQKDPFGSAITTIDARGVEVRVEGAGGAQPGAHWVGWDRVRRLVGAPGQTADAAKFSELADGLFRARARLERGDLRGAEPLFESLYGKQARPLGPTGALLAEGVLRLRLARGAQATAVIPWLDWLETRYEAGTKQLQGWVGGRMALPDVIDPLTGLSPRLPPICSMLDNPSGVRLLAEPSGWTRFDGADDAVRDIAAIYRASAAFEVAPGSPAALPAIKTTEDQVTLLAEIVRARIGGPEERKDARGRLAKRLATVLVSANEDVATDAAAGPGAAPGALAATRWQEAWLRAAIGRSLLREGGRSETRQGVIEMLHVPARLADASPELARLVLIEAADALARIGDDAGAAALKEELSRRFGPGIGEDGLIDETPAPTDAPPLDTEEGAG